MELENTLNAPEYQQKEGHQFISWIRTQAGVKWRITKLSSLDFFYRFLTGNRGLGPFGEEVGAERLDDGDVVQIGRDGEGKPLLPPAVLSTPRRPSR